MSLSAKIYARTQRPTYRVRVGNIELTKIESVMKEHDFDQATATCTITCAKKWGIEPNDFVEVWQGYGGLNEKTFTGYVDDVDKETFPKHMIIRCRDVLKRAIENFIVEEIEYDSVQAEEIVADLLERCGIYNYALDTTNFTVGDVEPAKFSLIFAMDAIRSVADLIGWRCWATPDGTVVFKKVFPRGALEYRWHYTKDPTFGSESGIIHVNHVSSDIDLRNWIEVWGWTNPTTGSTIEATAYADSPYVPDPPRYKKAVISNEIIDTQAMAEWVADRVLGDLNQLVDTMNATIQGNPNLHVGDTIRITEDWTDMASGVNYFVYGISAEQRAGGGYQMTLDLRGGRHSVPPWPEGQPPVASFEVKQVGWGDPHWIVYVDASASYDPDGVIVSYDFDWGDGSPHGTQVRDNHFYSSGSPGDPFTITLVVTDDDALTGTCSKDIILGSSGSGSRVYDRVLYFADTSGSGFGTPDSGNNWYGFACGAAVNCVSAQGVVEGEYAWFGCENGRVYKSADYCATGTLVYTFGSAVRSIWVDRVYEDVIFVGLADGSLYRTVDSGTTWTLLHTFDEGPIWNVFCEPGDINHIHCSGGTTAGYWYESIDGGVSWVNHGALWTGIELVRDHAWQFFQYYNAACQADPASIKRSEDDGASWIDCTGYSESEMRTITGSPFDPNVVLAGGENSKAVYRSTSGSGFETSGSVINGTKVTRLRFDGILWGTIFGGTDDDLELSFDRGSTWKQLRDAPGTVMDIAQGPLIPKVKRGIWSYGSGEVYFSPTGGTTWIKFATSGLSNFGTFLRVVGHPQELETAYMTSYNLSNTVIRVWKTTDGNVSWTQVGTISGAYSYAKVLTIDPIDPDILWIGACGIPDALYYIYKSIDGGQNWTPKYSSAVNGIPLAIGCSPADANLVLFVTQEYVEPISGDRYRIRQSTNGGDDWSIVSETFRSAISEHLRRGGMEFSANGERVVFKGGTDHPIAGGGSRVAISTDAGNTWSWSVANTPRAEGWDQNYPLKAEVGLNSHTMFVLSMSAPVSGTSIYYRSDDLGSTWSAKLSWGGRGFAIIDPQLVELLWAISYGSFKKSDDDGETWTTISNPGNVYFDDLSMSGWQEVLI